MNAPTDFVTPANCDYAEVRRLQWVLRDTDPDLADQCSTLEAPRAMQAIAAAIGQHIVGTHSICQVADQLADALLDRHLGSWHPED